MACMIIHNMYIYNQNDLGSNGKEMFELSFELFGYGQNYTFNGIIKLAHTTDSIFKSDATVNLTTSTIRTLQRG